MNTPMHAPENPGRGFRPVHRSAFTLVELLVVI
ncbi:MAG: prepilin-type N-terminal cleavage/methylation domain-containing protein, partial [Planctomycetia bacterium]|nr:prepilin-type N-terminal cleavage/methylation domain-containing protein [Planctomycetia bacterium]